MLMVVLLAVAGALGGGAIGYLTAPPPGACDDTLAGVTAACAAEGSGGRILLGAVVGALVPLLVAFGKRAVR